MKITKTLGISENMHEISEKFFIDINALDDLNYEANLCIRVESFFNKMNQFEKQEFANFLKMQQFNKENSINKRSIDAFYCLTALIIRKYSESDLARFFLSEELKENKSERSDSWRITYWFQLLSNWVAKLFGREKYQSKDGAVRDAIKYVRESMDKIPYIQLRTEKKFNDEMDVIIAKGIKSISIPTNNNETNKALENQEAIESKFIDAERNSQQDHQKSSDLSAKVPSIPDAPPSNLKFFSEINKKQVTELSANTKTNEKQETKTNTNVNNDNLAAQVLNYRFKRTGVVPVKCQATEEEKEKKELGEILLKRVANTRYSSSSDESESDNNDWNSGSNHSNSF
ncbi:MAG TPA: hypothetical protein VGH95_07025 [Candidatus Aquirickettsiella sp.]|jgi:hypothetical protein